MFGFGVCDEFIYRVEHEKNKNIVIRRPQCFSETTETVKICICNLSNTTIKAYAEKRKLGRNLVFHDTHF